MVYGATTEELIARAHYTYTRHAKFEHQTSTRDAWAMLSGVAQTFKYAACLKFTGQFRFNDFTIGELAETDSEDVSFSSSVSASWKFVPVY